MVPRFDLGPLVLLLGFFVFPCSVSADGLFHQLPTDGTWARFEAEWLTLEGPDQVKSRTSGSVQISSSGKESRDEEECRWIEIKTVRKKMDEPDFIELFRLLIPEKHLRLGEKPLDHIVEAWQKVGGLKNPRTGEIMEWDKQKPQLRPVKSLSSNVDLRFYLGGTLEEPQTLDAVTIESKIGLLPCQGVAGKSRIKDRTGTRETEFRQEFRLHKHAPFGVVLFRLDVIRSVNGLPNSEHSRAVLRLVDFGSEGNVELPTTK